MLYLALVFLASAVVAGVVGVDSIAGTAASTAHVFFVAFLILFGVSLLGGLIRRPPTA